MITFPADWVWGAATSAYQIEGAVREGGRGPSIWDTFSHTTGKITNDDTGDIACDHYHLFARDVELMRELGLSAYRFSISWPRIFPAGHGRPNTDGIDFYRRLIDRLHDAGIEPFVTLYHWDLPQALQDRGGWTNRDTVGRFGEFAHTMASYLGAGVHHWHTINEPWVAGFLGHLTGDHAPGLRDLRTALLATHNLLLAHGEAMSALSAEMRPGDEAGIVLNLAPAEPAGDSADDLIAATRTDGYVNRWFLDALYRGVYPEDMVELYGDAMPEVGPNDMAVISRPTDMLGVNYYTRSLVEFDKTALPLQFRRVVPPDAPVTAMGWEVYPRGLYDILRRVHDDYGPSRLYVTENGAAYHDVVVDGYVDDVERESFLRDHLSEAHRAIDGGIPLKGYFVWSLLDNFEWSWGYGQRFGIIYVDFSTQERIIKRSGRWYAHATRDNGFAE